MVELNPEAQRTIAAICLAALGRAQVKRAEVGADSAAPEPTDAPGRNPNAPLGHPAASRPNQTDVQSPTSLYEATSENSQRRNPADGAG